MTYPTDPTDPTDRLDALDALASDHLDGRTTAAEARRVATDPELAARVEALQAARAALRAEIPVDHRAREAAITAALDAYDAERAREHSPPLAAITAPATSRAPSRRTLQLVAMAAALVLLALAVPLLADLDRSDDSDDTAAAVLDADAFDESGTDLETSAPQVAEDSAGRSDAEAYSLGAPEDLGAFRDVASLVEAVRTRVRDPNELSESTTSAAGGAANPEASSAQVCADHPTSGEGTTWSATATIDGSAVLVLVRPVPSGGSELVVLDAADCSVVATRPL